MCCKLVVKIANREREWNTTSSKYRWLEPTKLFIWNGIHIDFYLSLSNTIFHYISFSFVSPLLITAMKFIQLTVHRDKHFSRANYTQLHISVFGWNVNNIWMKKKHINAKVLCCAVLRWYEANEPLNKNMYIRHVYASLFVFFSNWHVDEK